MYIHIHVDLHVHVHVHVQALRAERTHTCTKLQTFKVNFSPGWGWLHTTCTYTTCIQHSKVSSNCYTPHKGSNFSIKLCPTLPSKSHEFIMWFI